jgi:hypothetical protein
MRHLPLCPRSPPPENSILLCEFTSGSFSLNWVDLVSFWVIDTSIKSLGLDTQPTRRSSAAGGGRKRSSNLHSEDCILTYMICDDDKKAVSPLTSTAARILSDNPHNAN